MFGFFIGTACLLGLVATIRRRRFGRWAHHYGDFGFGSGGYGPPWAMAYGGACGGGPRGFGHGPWGRGGFGPGPDGEGPQGFEGRGFGGFARGGGVAARIAERLGLRDEQMATAKEAFRGLEEASHEIRKAGRKGREQLAAAFRGESLDEVSLGEAQATYEEMTEKARKAFVDALAKVHGVLDEEQRKAFARFLEGGAFGRPFGGPPNRGPYRGAWF